MSRATQLEMLRSNVAIAQRDVAVHEAAVSNARNELRDASRRLREFEKEIVLEATIEEMNLPKRTYAICKNVMERVEECGKLRNTRRTRQAFYQISTFVKTAKLPSWCKNYSPVEKANYLLTRCSMLLESDTAQKSEPLRYAVKERYKEVRDDWMAENA